MPPVIEHVRDVLHHHCKRRARVDIAEILDIELRPGIVSKGFGMVGDLTQLGSSDPGEGLARRATDKDVD